MDLGESVKKWREFRRFSVTYIAHKAGIPLNTMYRLERGTHKNLRWEHLYALTRVLGVSTFEQLAEGPPDDRL